MTDILPGLLLGVLFNDLERRLYVPLPPSPTAPPGLIYLGVEYESYAVDFKVFVTAPSSSQYVDMAFSGRQKTKVGKVGRHFLLHNRLLDLLVKASEAAPALQGARDTM
jgi:hypothetical protein